MAKVLARKLYEEINAKLSVKCDLKKIELQYPEICPKTLLAIHVQKEQEIARKAIVTHNSPSLQQRYYNIYKDNCSSDFDEEFIVKFSKSIGLPPCILARIILKYHFLSLNETATELAAKQYVKKSMKEPDSIEDEQLRLSTEKAIMNDPLFCPEIDKLRHEIGNTYESNLYKDLEDRKLHYIEETKMRGLGFAKTPDVLLAYPIAINGYIVNWIESKASFGDDFLHNKNMEQQYWSYHNRFGPGMVIYWFGYIEDLNRCNDQGILVSHELPTNIIQIQSPFLTETS